MFEKIFKRYKSKFGYDTASGEKIEEYEGEAHYYEFQNDILKQMTNSDSDKKNCILEDKNAFGGI